MGVKPGPATSPLVPLSFITTHDPVQQMTATTADAEHSRCRQGRGGAHDNISIVIVMDL